ncbi:MAG: response regulator [Rubellimicrobium sp.]|nr:response regulator [Rubellimicrobium sp.]
MRICVVEDQVTSLAVLTGALRRLGEHEIEGFSAPDPALERCAEVQFDLVFVDHQMPGKTGVEVIGELRRFPGYDHVPIIMITADHDRDLRIEAINQGATDFLNKPVDPQELRIRARNLLSLRQAQLELADRALHLASEVERATRKLADREREVIWRLARAIDLRDDMTGHHVTRVARVSQLIACRIRSDADFCKTIFLAAPLHDTGKIAIPDAILNKPGRLSDAEMVIMRRHAEFGAELLAGGESELMRLACEIALTHHEKWDGSGYPAGLAGDAIPLSGRIVAVADVFDALCSLRPYKQVWPLAEGRAEIHRLSGSHFDPDCVRAFDACWPEIEEIYSKMSSGPATPPRPDLFPGPVRAPQPSRSLQ